jgi:hypothetical protein
MLLVQVNGKLTTLGLGLLLIFASLAVGLAHKNVGDGSAYTVSARLGIPAKVSRAERYGLVGGLDCETCDISTPFTKFSTAPRPLDAAPVIHADLLAAAHSHVPKISLHMLASVLLI